ncbi:hypothetical protein POSPLADRAFT_1059996 [Postia placenta MAD-698-R-SB12]|uniref:DUF4604 domain-containing protein n=1 Tax=Postia placenta MAD-698-R-SB12 TaxID=670580 RepID=A0A1X6MR84_9APHY|nr:hypothetical protein POSPLADRAFT_1059996 [Postia placenta MAD-698-R-SB12]OSX58905.1 hypothetical protein POSPLADRAFT_1059996 [Postia placenta MAD-698-R-SB12]
MSKEPTRHQLSARLAYNARTPTFLLKMQQRVSGARADDDDDDDDDEYEHDGSGRPPIPKRPAIPERPDDDPGSANEDDGDEKPQVVVLREGKHLSAREVENEKRKAKGLPPLPDPDAQNEQDPPAGKTDTNTKPAGSEKKAPTQGLSFSSSSAAPKTKNAKRKAVGDARDDEPGDRKAGPRTKKKAKKAQKTLLSFGDGDEA